MSTRDELYQEINDTRIRFLQLLDTIPENAYAQPSNNPAWTIGEVLYHMTVAPRFMSAGVKMIVGQKWFYRLIPIVVPIVVPKSLFNWLNKILTLYGARNLSREFLATEYEKAHYATLKALAEVSDNDFEKYAYFPDWDPLLSGEVTLERLFHYVKTHFDSHAEQLVLLSSSPVD